MNYKKTVLTQKRLKEVLDYNPETGDFFRRKSSGGKIIGCKAGGLSNKGYIHIRVDNQPLLAHRLAFLYMEGNLPNDEVDHIDRNKINNSWKNLRQCNRSNNMQNTGKKITNTSGYIGVNKQQAKWQARISVNGTRLYLGLFDCPIEAAASYDIAAEKYFGEFACLNFALEFISL